MFHSESIGVKDAQLCLTVPGLGTPKVWAELWWGNCVGSILPRSHEVNRFIAEGLPHTGLSSLLSAGEAEMLEKLNLQCQRRERTDRSLHSFVCVYNIYTQHITYTLYVPISPPVLLFPFLSFIASHSQQHSQTAPKRVLPFMNPSC